VKIGLLVRYSDAEIRFLTEHGFRSLELLIWPGDPLDPLTTRKRDLLAARDRLAEAGLEVSAIGSYGNNLDPDPAKARAHQKHLIRLMAVCELFGVKTLCTFAGRDPEKSIADNIPAFKKAFSKLARMAEDRGLEIAFENCPMFHAHPFRGVNIAYTPAAWDLMFDAVPSPALGIEYDPSHLVCLLIDYLDVIYRYGRKIMHVHAKDAEVVWRNVTRVGILEPGAVRHRMPGLGQVDWGKVVSALVENGYTGNLDIEGRHDPVFRGEREEQGLLISLKHLRQFVA
jgi:sugar phosphate isomerase/epimerase